MIDYAERPMLVFWETTRACQLACRHCRASAMAHPLPGELNHLEGVELLEQLADFGRPHPILVLTGGDCLLRPDLFQLVERAEELGIPTALSPSVTAALTPERIAQIKASGVRAVSISLDGVTAATHDGVRRIEGLFDDTLIAIRRLVDAGVPVQVNTTVMRSTVDELAAVASLITRLGVHAWEVFFLVPVGRGAAEEELTPQENEQVCHFLFDAAHYGPTVRTVEAPFFRRVVAERRAAGAAPSGELYRRLTRQLRHDLGAPDRRPSAHTAATRDGKGIVFVAHDGEVYPAGFLPLSLGSVREHAIVELYREDERMLSMRSSAFEGRCGRCEFADLCGGSRARAYAATGNVLGEDPACAYQPSA